MANFVPDDGSKAARLVLIGEAPGSHENANLRPFVGPSGWKLRDWWASVGLQRSDFYITNVHPYQPPANKIELIPKAELERSIDELHGRLAALEDPYVIVPTGNTALRALTGKVGITKHRGSIYTYTDRRGRTIKVVPTIHPAAVFRTPGWERRCLRDWARIADERLTRGVNLPAREHLIRPTLSDVEDYLHDAGESAEVMAVDIETVGGAQGAITCIGFSRDPLFSITIPLTPHYWGTDLNRVWESVRILLALPCEKVFQNGHYDNFWLEDYEAPSRNWRWDTLAMHHALDPTDEHSLAFMASVDTREPYWKDDYKDGGNDDGHRLDLDVFWRYNGKDACVTRELYGVYRERLEKAGLLPFYQRHYADLFKPLLSMMRHGLLVDEGLRAKRHAKLIAECVGLQEEIAALAGKPLHSTTKNKKRDLLGKIPDLSAKKVADYLYNELRLPKVLKRATGKPTADEITIRKLMLKHAAKPLVTDVCSRVLDHRRKKKLSEFLDEGALDADGRLRCTYKFTTDTGRLASSKSPRRTGRNLQNLDREIRRVYVPDPGTLFVEADLSQAEDRIVKALAVSVPGVTKERREELLWRARSMPWENDEHKRAAVAIFKVALAAVTKDQRYLAKRGRHAGNYGMGGHTLSDDLLKEGVVVTPEEATGMIEAIHAADPEVRMWQADTRQRVMQDRVLSNSWGRMLSFEHERLDDDAYRRAYAFVPQSEVPAIINQYGLVPVWRWLRQNKLRARLQMQTHDSLTLSVPPDEVWAVMDWLWTALERPRKYRGVELMIPCEFKLGRTLAGDVEFKRRPTRDEVMAAVEKLR